MTRWRSRVRVPSRPPHRSHELVERLGLRVAARPAPRHPSGRLHRALAGMTERGRRSPLTVGAALVKLMAVGALDARGWGAAWLVPGSSISGHGGGTPARLSLSRHREPRGARHERARAQVGSVERRAGVAGGATHAGAADA